MAAPPQQVARQGTSASWGQMCDFQLLEMASYAQTHPNHEHHRRLARRYARKQAREQARKKARKHLVQNYKALIIKAMLDMMKDKLIKSLLLGGRQQTPLGQAVNEVVNCSRGLMSPLGRVLRY